jgi:methylated-DNA-[protein]-cysteine S-methyltransferase
MLPVQISTVETSLGWLGIATQGDELLKVSLAYRTATEAEKLLRKGLSPSDITKSAMRDLQRRLRLYCDGQADDFLDIKVADENLSPFLARVRRICRQIPYGETLSYGELAAKAGSARAARAVGNCMATNPTPIVVPCHRVVYSDGSIGHYSAAGGQRLKERLLVLEGAVATV